MLRQTTQPVECRRDAHVVLPAGRSASTHPAACRRGRRRVAAICVTSASFLSRRTRLHAGASRPLKAPTSFRSNRKPPLSSISGNGKLAHRGSPGPKGVEMLEGGAANDDVAMRAFPAPPPGFRPDDASAEKLSEFGFPPRPAEDADPSLLEHWRAIVALPVIDAELEFAERSGPAGSPDRQS